MKPYQEVKLGVGGGDAAQLAGCLLSGHRFLASVSSPDTGTDHMHWARQNLIISEFWQ